MTPPAWYALSARVGSPLEAWSPYQGGGEDSDGSGGDGEKTLQRWSSLIGIITAIVGNMLIAMALNVQRYAHTRLHSDRLRARRKTRAALRRANSRGPGRGGAYGTTADHSGNGYSNGNDSDNGNGNGGGNENELVLDNGHETDPLTASFQSTATQEMEDELVNGKVASTYLKSPYWWLGQILITLGETGNFLAYGFAPASIVSPLGVVALIANCIIAPVMFKERFRQRDFWGVVIAVGGVATVVLSANQEEKKLNPSDVWDAITTLEFEIYMAVTIGLIITLMWVSSRYGRRTILIDLGLVGLFGEPHCFFSSLLLLVRFR